MVESLVATKPEPTLATKSPEKDTLPTHNGEVTETKTPHIRAEGESGRRGINPLATMKICFRSSCTLSKFVNFLWPFVPVALAMHWARPEEHLWNFILPYIAMVPTANLLGFAGQELARKLPHVLGIVMEVTFGSVVEIILFMVLISKGEASVPIIKAAILGSILANLLLCLGCCFFAAGIREGREEVTFNEAVTEVGSNLMLVAGMGLIVPAAFAGALNNAGAGDLTIPVLKISRATSVILVIAFVIYVFFQTRSHKGLYEAVLIEDEEKDADRHHDLKKAKLTLTESILALVFALAMVTLMAVFLVGEIEYIVNERHVKDAFVGLILVPLVEKTAEHITALDEAWDNQMNLALATVLGSSIQTALLNTPLVVFVGWGLGYGMDLDFEVFNAVILILAILVVGGFLRDAKTNYLEGVLCVLVYIIIAIAAFYYPNPHDLHGTTSGETSALTTSAAAAEATAAAHRRF